MTGNRNRSGMFAALAVLVVVVIVVVLAALGHGHASPPSPPAIYHNLTSSPGPVAP